MALLLTETPRSSPAVATPQLSPHVAVAPATGNPGRRGGVGHPPPRRRGWRRVRPTAAYAGLLRCSPGVSTSLPKLPLVRMSPYASSAPSSGNVRDTTGLTRPAAAIAAHVAKLRPGYPRDPR